MAENFTFHDNTDNDGDYLNQFPEGEQRRVLQSEILFIELKPEVRQRLGLPRRVPILKHDLETEFKNGVIPPSAWAAGIEALKMLHPNIQEYDTFLARYYLLEGRRAFDENDDYAAQRSFQKALDLNKAELSAEAAFYLAGMIATTSVNEALEYYRRSIALNPVAAAPHFEMARLLRERRDLQGALDEFNQAATLEPTSANVYNEIAETYTLANDPDSAIAALKQAIAIEPDSWFLPVKLGILQYDQEDYKSALKTLRRGLDKAPDELDGSAQAFYVQGLYYLGLSYQQSGDLIRARRLFQAVLGLAPDHPGALQALS